MSDLTDQHWRRHDDVIKWKHFPRYWPFVWGIHRFTVNSPHKGQWQLSKQSWGWWFEMPPCPLWRHSNEIHTFQAFLNFKTRFDVCSRIHKSFPKYFSKSCMCSYNMVTTAEIFDEVFYVLWVGGLEPLKVLKIDMAVLWSTVKKAN